MSLEDIFVRLKFEDKLKAPLEKTIARLTALNNKQKELLNTYKINTTQKKLQLKQVGSQFNSFGKVMGMPIEQWKKFNQAGGKFTSRGTKMANTFRRATHGLRGFRMEMLSVMFFGKGMQQFFFGLLRPAMEAVGIFELWGAVLQLVFLPIALALLDILLPIFTWMMNWSDETKLLVGKIVLLAIGLGIFLFLVGSLTLGIGGLIIVGSSFFNIITKISEGLFGGQNALSSFMAIGMSLVALTAIWSGFQASVGYVVDKLLELEFVNDFLDKMNIHLTEDMSGWEKFETIVGGVWDYIRQKVLDLIKGVDINLADSLKGLIPDITTIQDEVDKIVEKFKLEEMMTNISELNGNLKDLIPSLKTISELVGMIVKGINFFLENQLMIGSIVTGVIGGTAVGGPLGGIIGGVIGAGAGAIAQMVQKKEGPKQSGGYIPHTGLYKLHAGESVNQAGSNTFSPNIVVNASSNVDIEMLKSQLSSQWNDDFARMSRG